MAEKFVILYTHQKTKKHKTWQDGTLTISKDGEGTLKNDGGQNIDTIRIKKSTNVGDDLESAKYLIQIDDVCPADFDKKNENSSTKEQENSQKKDDKAPRFRNKLPKFSKHAPVVGYPNLQANMDDGQTGNSEFLKCSTNLTKRCLDSQDEEKSVAGEIADPQSIARVKKRKKFCVPRRVVTCTDDQDSIPNWNGDSQDEMSDMVCTVVRQDPNGIFQTIQYNQPPDVSKAPVGTSHHQSLIGAKKHRPQYDRAGSSHSIVNDGTNDDDSFNNIRNCEALGGARVKKTSARALPINNFSIEVDKNEDMVPLHHVNPIRSAKEILEIIKRAKNRKNSNTNVATNGALDSGSDATPRGQTIFECKAEGEERTSFSKMKTGLESATMHEEIPIMREVSAPKSELKIMNIPGNKNMVSKEESSILDCDSNAGVKKDEIVRGNESPKLLEHDNTAPLQRNTPTKVLDVSIGNRNPIFSIDEEDDWGQDVTPDFDFALEFDV